MSECNTTPEEHLSPQEKILETHVGKPLLDALKKKHTSSEAITLPLHLKDCFDALCPVTRGAKWMRAVLSPIPGNKLQFVRLEFSRDWSCVLVDAGRENLVEIRPEFCTVIGREDYLKDYDVMDRYEHSRSCSYFLFPQGDPHGGGEPLPFPETPNVRRVA